MHLLTIDFETYYSTKDGYTLSKMTAEEYIRDPRFQIIGVSIKVDNQPVYWTDNHGGRAVAAIRSLDWGNGVALGHNMSEFDALILTEKCGVFPAHYQCTLAMGRALHGGKVSNSLANLAKRYNLKPKGDAVLRADGMRLEDFTPAQLASYGVYCDDDVDICHALYHLLRKHLPATELQYLSMMIRMWAEPRLELDSDLLAKYLAQLSRNKQELLNRAGVSQQDLRSDAKFAELLRERGVEPPLKYSKKRKDANGNPLLVYAFAKTDPQMEDLVDDPDDEVATLAAARVGVKTTIEESRTERLLGISQRGRLPVPLAYGKTHTHRAAGSGKINLQNMGRPKSVGKRTLPESLLCTPSGIERLQGVETHSVNDKPVMCVRTLEGNVWVADDVHVVGLRDMIVAPEGKALVVADSSNIELRVCHALAGQMDTVEQLRNKEDLYCSFASDLYSRPITKKDKRERLHGKVSMLQLQYQSGAGSFRNAARVMGGLHLTEDEAQGTVQMYRGRFAMVKKFWYRCEKAIDDMYCGREAYIDDHGLCRTVKDAIILPNGMAIRYFDLRKVYDPETGREQWEYDDKEKRHAKKVYGGSVTENLCQALAREIVFAQTLEIDKRYGGPANRGDGVVLQVHDEVVALVDEDKAEECLSYMLEVMSTPPTWWPWLPVAAEGAIEYAYGSAK